jgi:hypothetical protein
MTKLGMMSKVRVIAIAAFSMMAVSACDGQQNGGQNPIIDGIQGPSVTFSNDKLLINTVLTNVIFEGGVSIPIPHTSNSFIQVGPNTASSGMLLQVGLSVTDLAFLDANANILPPNQLPGGRPLPGIVGGVLPSIAVQVPQWDNATFYIGTAFIGVFIPVKIGAQGFVGSFLFYDSNGKQIGTISVVGSDSDGKNSGFLLMLNLKSIMPSSSTQQNPALFM